MKVIDQKSGKDWTLYCGDTTEVIKGIPDNSLHFQVYSPPFSSLYIYSSSIADMGNCRDDEEFFKHYEFLLPELYRTLVPGRLSAVHCKDLVDYKNRDGRAGLRDFPGDIIRLHEKHGFKYHSRVTIWKDPVIEMQRTKSQGLLHAQIKRDSTMSRQGLPDYLLLFRKWPEDGETSGPEPVSRGGLERYVGENRPDDRHYEFYYDTEQEMWILSTQEDVEEKNEDGVMVTKTAESINQLASIHVWQRYASPVWFDIQQTDVLNCRAARDPEDEKHICPLQIGVIKRAVHLWTNPNDIVFTPFAGIGSELHGALQMGRRAVGCELKEAYYKTAVKYLTTFENRHRQLSMF